MTERVELPVRPPSGIIQYKAARFPVQLLLLEKFGYTHGFDGTTGSVGQKERQTLGLQRWYDEKPSTLYQVIVHSR